MLPKCLLIGVTWWLGFSLYVSRWWLILYVYCISNGQNTFSKQKSFKPMGHRGSVHNLDTGYDCCLLHLTVVLALILCFLNIYKYFFIFQCYLSVSDALNSFFSKSAPVLTNLNNLIVWTLKKIKPFSSLFRSLGSKLISYVVSLQSNRSKSVAAAENCNPCVCFTFISIVFFQIDCHVMRWFIRSQRGVSHSVLTL